jgi:hypothetical protein
VITTTSPACNKKFPASEEYFEMSMEALYMGVAVGEVGEGVYVLLDVKVGRSVNVGEAV